MVQSQSILASEKPTVAGSVNSHLELQVGDLVRIAPGTLAWSAEASLRKKVGRVISKHDDENGTPRVTVQYSYRRILARRVLNVFELVERGAEPDGDEAVREAGR